MSATCEDMLLNDEMTSCLSVEPTATAVEMQPGAEIALVKPLLPAGNRRGDPYAPQIVDARFAGCRCRKRW